MTDTLSSNALTGTHDTQKGAGESQMIAVAKRHGVSPFRQFAEIFRLRRGRNQMTALEYYDYQLFRPDLPAEKKREFVGDRGSYALNLRLAPPALTHMRNFLSDKLGLTAMMGALGLRTTTLQAACSPTRGFGTLRTLRNAAEVETFLRAEARFPLFGKPIRGAQARGSVMITGIEGDTAILGNGQRTPLAQLAGEIAANTEHGYVFQDAAPVAPAIAALTGSPAVSTLRVVTVNRTGTPEVLYTAWKLPSPRAMSDNFWQEGSLIAEVDATSGIVRKVRQGTGLATQWVDKHPVTGADLTGIALPGFDGAVALARAAHAVVPDNGILGWDIGLTEGGATLIECNENTGHALYQLSSDRGILNADFLPVFDAVMARNAKMAATHEADRKAYHKAQSRF